MRISTIAVVLVLLGGAVGYCLGAQQRRVEPDAYGFAPPASQSAADELTVRNYFRDHPDDPLGITKPQPAAPAPGTPAPPASQKFAFSNRYDCEVLAMRAEQADTAMGRALLAAHPELDAPVSANAPAALPAEPECEPLTFAQVHAAGFMLVPRESPRDSGGNSND